MNDDGGEEYEGEAQADECVPGGEEAEAEGELVWVSEECPPETAAPQRAGVIGSVPRRRRSA